MLDDMRGALGVSLKRLGYSINSTNPEEINKAKHKKKLRKHKKIMLKTIQIFICQKKL